MTKLIITDRGDASVGIFSTSWEIEVPYEIKDDRNLSSDDKDSLEFFRSKMIEVYKEFCEGRCIAVYDFEYRYEID